MTLRSRLLALIAAGLACAPGFGWAQADTLQHDPFARPAYLKGSAPPAGQSRDNARLGKETSPAPAWKPELDAVVMAGPNSMVSIDGTIVGIGEEINGYRLAEVNEQTAVFVKNRKRLTLWLRGTQPVAGTAPAGKGQRAARGRPDAPQAQDAPRKLDARGTAERRDDRKLEEK